MIGAPLSDHAGRPSWTATIVVAWMAVIVASLALMFFAPDWVAERVVNAESFLRDSFFAVVVAYVVRRHTQAKHECDGKASDKEPPGDE